MPGAQPDRPNGTQRILRKFRGALTQSPREMLTAAHATAVMGVVEILVRVVRLPTACRVLGCQLDLDSPSSSAPRLPLKELESADRRCVTATRRVADAWPFSRGPCLRRALVIGHLLRHLTPVIRLGLATGGNEMFAHAWVEIGGRPLEDVSSYLPFAGSAVGERTERNLDL